MGLVAVPQACFPFDSWSPQPYEQPLLVYRSLCQLHRASSTFHFASTHPSGWLDASTMSAFVSSRSQMGLVAGRQQQCVQAVTQPRPAVQPSRTHRARCVKPDCIYSKQPEHRRELEVPSALALTIDAGARSSYKGLSTASLSQSPAPRRVRVAVDVDEGQWERPCSWLLTSCTTTAAPVPCPFQSSLSDFRNRLDAAVLGRFVYALNIFCKEAYGMDYDVSDFWVYEFAKVGHEAVAPFCSSCSDCYVWFCCLWCQDTHSAWFQAVRGVQLQQPFWPCAPCDACAALLAAAAAAWCLQIWNCSQDQSNHIVHEFFKSDHFNDGIPIIPGVHHGSPAHRSSVRAPNSETSQRFCWQQLNSSCDSRSKAGLCRDSSSCSNNLYGASTCSVRISKLRCFGHTC